MTEPEIKALLFRVKEQARQLAIQQQALHERNLSLDAMHYVWCDGGCNGGTHRFVPGKITEELVVDAERNVKRLRTWFENFKFKNKAK